MAIKCLHSNHSNPDDQQKCQKIHGEQVPETKGMKINGDTYNLVHLKHDWYDKGDSVVVHLYIKCLHENLLDVILHEDHLQVKFATSNAEFLKMHQGTTSNTLFSWSLKLKGKVDLAKSSCRVAKAYLEMSLKKSSSERWSGLERLNKPGLKETTISSADKPFRQIFGYKSKTEDSECEKNLTNGIQHFNDLYTCEDTGCRSKESVGTVAGSHLVDGKEVRRNSLEEKSASNRDSNAAMGSVTPSSNLHNSGEKQCVNCVPCDVGTSYVSECIPQDIETGEFLQVCDRNTPFGSQCMFKQVDVRTSDSSVNEPDSAGSEESGSSHSNMPNCNAQYTMTLPTTEKLTVTFSSLPNAVQPSIVTSTSSSLSASESTYMLSSRAPIPAPPPPPKAPILQGCDESHVKTGMMGGSRSKTTELPFRDAIRAAASKGSNCNSYIKEEHGAGVFTEESDPPGYTGLDNLGNTCYLNSIVQCLANARELRDFFLTDSYKDDINTENPLGTGGRLAIVFASLMKNLWSGRERSLSPYKLKSVVGEKVCQFKGFTQQDAQEFMAFLLDGLHEDLNRVKEKPYVEEVKGAGKPDSEVAYEAWKRYKSRNDSIIVDLFQGQLKSKLTCPMCKKISIKYDPFMNLSVPLPKEVKPLPVYVFFKDCRKLPLKVVVQVAQDATVEQLTGSVEHKTGIQPENMRVYEVFNGKFHKAFLKGSSLSSVVESDIIVVYEVLSEKEAGEEVYEVPIMQRLVWSSVVPAQCASCYKPPGPREDLKRCTQCWTIGYCNPKCQKEHWPIHKRSCKIIIPQPVGIPFVVSLPASQATFENLQYMAEEYSKYSIEVHLGESLKKASLTKGECSTDVNKAASDTAQEGPCLSKENCPKFYFKPVTAHGEAVTGEDGARLKDEGSRPLNLSDKYLSLDWRNHPRTSGFVVVEEKDNLEFDEHPSCITETTKEFYSCSLRECLELFTEPETLSENDAWYCPHCKAHREATKQLSVWRLPEILIIHLKRFSFRNILFRDKITKLVDFPLKGLDMSGFTLGRDDKEDSLYDLFAVANHTGTVSFGHYTAFARLGESNSSVEGLKRDGLGWRNFDDRNVTETLEQRVVSKYAYVLFYKRRHDSDNSPTEQAPMADTPTEQKKASLEDVDENELD